MSEPRKPYSGRVPLRTIIATYARSAKRYRYAILATFLFYGIGNFLREIILKFSYRDIFDILASSPAAPALWPALASILLRMTLILLAYNALFRIADFFIVYSQAVIMRDLTDMATDKLQRHSYHFFAGNFAGSLVAKVRRFVRSFEKLYDQLVFQFWETGIQLVGVFVVLIMLMPSLAIFFGLWCVVFITATFFFVRFRLRYDFLSSEADSLVTGELSDIITNVVNLKVFTSEKREMARFGQTTQKEYKARSKSWYVGNAFFFIQGLAMAVLEIAGMYIALKLWIGGSVTAGTVVLVQVYFAEIMSRVWGIGRAMSDTFIALSDGEEMVTILEKPLEVSDPSLPEPCKIHKGTVAFRNVAFQYRKGKEVFTDFSLTIPAGQRVGIVGHSGAGKSTIMKLLLRFADVTGGGIEIDGQDLRNITQNDLRKSISYVPQDPILFHRSLYENIAYAAPEATREEIIKAAKRAHAHDFIETLHQGYDTFVGERGIKLSGGERQRIAIARAILKNAPILLLDEATSSLDSVSEQYIQEQLAELMHGRTTLAIAHRISTIRQMDRIVVLSDGKISEEGTHDELLKHGGIYADLWGHQSQGFLMEETDKDDLSTENSGDI
ncbi:MAG: ABC transporter ATP-binding protein [Candidatus Peregrinibacteria bacterium]